MDYYGHTFGDQEKDLMAEHFGTVAFIIHFVENEDFLPDTKVTNSAFSPEHCIELLRQGVMCRGDTTLVTFHWGATVKLPQPDFTLEHTCVDWDVLMGWASNRAINVFETGMLVHPKFGTSPTATFLRLKTFH